MKKKRAFEKAGTVVRTWWHARPLWGKIVVVVLVIAAGGIIVRHHIRTTNLTVETIREQTLTHSVSATGSVVSSTEVMLGFDQSKRLSGISVRVGKKVKKGDVLATLSNSAERAALSSAKVSLTSARATYNKVLEGSASKEVQLAQTFLTTTKKTQDALVAAATHKLYSTDIVAVPQTDMDTVPTVTGVYMGTDEGDYQVTIVDDGHFQYSGLEKGSGKLRTTPQPLGTKGLSIAFPDPVDSPDDAWTISIPNKSGASYAANQSAYRSAIATHDSAIAHAQSALDLTRATARQPDIDIALAQVVTAQAAVDAANAALQKTILYAPADGVITAVYRRAGATPPAGAAVIGLRDTSNLYVQAHVSESDLKQIAVGQSVTVSFDTGLSYHTSVSSVDPTAVTLDGVTSYTVKAVLPDTDGITTGMTAHLTIQTAEVPNALVVSAQAIETKDGVSSVLLVTDERHHKSVVQPVTEGLHGDGGLVEIHGDLKAGNKVFWPTKK